MDKKTLDQLGAPFPPESVGHKPKITCRACANKDTKCDQHKVRKCRDCHQVITTAHLHLDFVGHAYVRERLNEVDPDWNWEPVSYNDQGLPAIYEGCLWIRLTIAGKTMLGVGDAPGKRGGDALKEMIGDALRNAGQSFGIALQYWKKEPASAASEDVPDRQVERPAQTPEQRAAELRGQIAAVEKAKGKDINQIADEFVQWSRGTDIGRASVAVLVEYLDYLKRGVSS